MNEVRTDFGSRLRFARIAIYATALLGLTLLAGCEPTLAQRDEPFATARASAAVAFAEAEIAQEALSHPAACDEPEDSQTVVAPPRRRRLLYFTAAWCPTCRANEPTLAALAARGWSIGTADSNHIQIVDLDAAPEIARRFGVEVVPTWVFIDDGVTVRCRVGVLDPFAVGRLFEP